MKAEAENTKEINKFSIVDAEAQGRQADLRHRAIMLRWQVRRADRLAQHHRDADAGRREGLREQGPGHRVRPWCHHRLPGDVRPPHRRLRLRRRRGGVPRATTSRRAARSSPCASCRAWTCSRPVGRRAKNIFDEAGLNVVGVEFTDGDAAKTKSIVCDYLQKEGTIDGVWMDAGATAVAAIEAFEDSGQAGPVDHG